MIMNKKFALTEIFRVSGSTTTSKLKMDLSKEQDSQHKFPYITTQAINNGIAGYSDKWTEQGNVLTVDSAVLGTCFWQANKFTASDHVEKLTPLFEMDEKIALYMVAAINKIGAELGYSYQKKRSQKALRAEIINLPVVKNPNPDHEYTVDDIDWQYMRDHITELERDHITELDAYLQATGLNDYELTEDDKKILSLSAKRAFDENRTLEDNSEDEVKIAPFELTELFIKKTIRGVPKKDEDLTENPNGYHIFGQNIKYQYEHKVLMDGKYLQTVEPHKPILAYTSSVGEIGMITESFYRTGDNGAFQGLFPLFDINEYAMRYILTVLQKHFADFGYATSMANIMSMKIYLPIKSDGTPDFDYMERYIRAMEKVVIADVVKYKDKIIETMKKVVGE